MDAFAGIVVVRMYNTVNPLLPIYGRVCMWSLSFQRVDWIMISPGHDNEVPDPKSCWTPPSATDFDRGHSCLPNERPTFLCYHGSTLTYIHSLTQSIAGSSCLLFLSFSGNPWKRGRNYVLLTLPIKPLNMNSIGDLWLSEQRVSSNIQIIIGGNSSRHPKRAAWIQFCSLLKPPGMWMTEWRFISKNVLPSIGPPR